MLSKEEIENFIQEMTEVRPEKLNEEALRLYNTIMKILDKNEQTETENKKLKEDKKELIELNNKYLQKLVYALSPTKHALGDDYNTNFKKIIAENIDLETCKIKQKLKDSEEFKNNMCEHRCVKNTEIIELRAKANKYDSLVENIKKDLIKLQEEYEILLEHQSGQESNRTKYLRGKIHMCQELLDTEKEKV